MKGPSWWIFVFGLTLGVSSTQLEFKDKGGSQSTASALTFDRSADLTAGLFAELKFPKVKWLSIRNDLTHRKYDAESGDYYNGVGATHAFGSVTASYLKYSLSFRAALAKTTLQPFLTAGISPSLLLSQSNQFLIDYGVTQQRQSLLDKTKSFEFGFYGGAGVIR